MKTNADVTARIAEQGFLAKLSLQSAESVAQQSLRQLYKGKTIIIVGFMNKLNRILMQLIPNVLLIPLISNALKKELRTKKEYKNVVFQ